MASRAGVRAAALDREERRQWARTFQGLNAFERHKMLLAQRAHYSSAAAAAADRQQAASQGPQVTDHDIVHQTYRFERTDEDDERLPAWQRSLAQRYYARLFKEYCIADLSRARESPQGGPVGLRWRTEAEVVAGKGQFQCGARKCTEQRGLASYEVNFSYREAGEAKAALVKLRVCPEHAAALGSKFHKKKESEGEEEDEGEAGAPHDESAAASPPEDEEQQQWRHKKEKKKKKKKSKKEKRSRSRDREEDKDDGSGDAKRRKQLPDTRAQGDGGAGSAGFHVSDGYIDRFMREMMP